MPETSWLARNREPALAALATLLITLVRLFFNHRINFCGTPDSCSYLALAQSLSSRHTFAQDLLYQYQFVPLRLPSHGIEYWRPGTSFFLLLAHPFGGVTLHPAQAVTTLMAIALAAAAWRIAMDWSGKKRLALASYLLCFVLPPIWIGATTPDSAIFYGTFVAWFLILFRVRRRSRWHDAAALACVSIVNLIRNDAILLLVPLVIVLYLRHRNRESARSGPSLAYSALIVAGFFAAMLPMNLIDFAVLHRAFPPGNGGALYLNDLSDLMLYKQPITLHTMLAVGAGKLIKMRLLALPMILYRMIFIQLGWGALFLAVLFKLRRQTPDASHRLPELAGSLTFFAVVVAVYGFALPAIGTFSALRSFVGLLPIASVLIVAAIRAAAASESIAGCLTASLTCFYLASGIMQDRRTIDDVRPVIDRDARIAAYLASTGSTPANGTRVMTADPAAFYVQTGYSTIPMPNKDLAMMAAAAHDLQATHIAIDQDFDTDSEHEIVARLHPAAIVHIPQTHMLLLTLDPRR